MGIGAVLKEVKFVEKVAQIGGSVYSTGSGIQVTVDKIGVHTVNLTTF